MNCFEYFEGLIDDLTPAQLAEIEAQYQTTGITPGEFMRWVIKKLEEWVMP